MNDLPKTFPNEALIMQRLVIYVKTGLNYHNET